MDSIPQKHCNRCKQFKPATSDYFGSDKTKPDSLYTLCKTCTRKRDTARYSQRFPRKTPTQRTQQTKCIGYKYCPHCKQYLLATPDYFSANKTTTDHLEIYCKTCRKQYRPRKTPIPEPVPDGYKRCALCQKDKPATPKFFIRNKGLTSGLNSYCKECWASINHTRRAREQNNGGTYTAQDIQTKLTQQKDKCYYCKKKLNKYHIDHIVPVSRGGNNNPDNLVLACPFCNLSKGNKLLHEWHQGNRLL